jgi:lipopolysaccharide/colanic/teichoic acid biosynthesis glycosyltransferase
MHASAGRTRAETIGYIGKRLLDLTIAIPALLLLSPVLAVVAALIARRMGRPVIFSQTRPGLHEQPFRLHKFRTMSLEFDARGRSLPDRDRLTPLGRSLRAWSLDELPELFDVLTGSMSLVGPRPLLTHYLPYFTDQERARFSVRPGITGWAQVNGRNELPWDERLGSDVWYVDHCSLLLDLRILAWTAYKVLRREDVQVDSGIVETDLAEERRDAGAAPRRFEKGESSA